MTSRRSAKTVGAERPDCVADHRESRVFWGSVGIVRHLQDDASLEIQIKSLEAAMKLLSEVNVVILVGDLAASSKSAQLLEKSRLSVV